MYPSEFTELVVLPGKDKKRHKIAELVTVSLTSCSSRWQPFGICFFEIKVG